MSADAPFVSTYRSSGQGCISITAEPPGNSSKVCCWFASCPLLSASGNMRDFPFLFPTSWQGLGLFGLIHAPRDLLPARCWSFLGSIPTGRRYSELSTPADAGMSRVGMPRYSAVCLRQGYAFATNALPGDRSIFFPVGSFGSVYPARRPPEFAAGDDKCNGTALDGGVHHAPYGPQ